MNEDVFIDLVINESLNDLKKYGCDDCKFLLEEYYETQDETLLENLLDYLEPYLEQNFNLFETSFIIYEGPFGMTYKRGLQNSPIARAIKNVPNSPILKGAKFAANLKSNMRNYARNKIRQKSGFDSNAIKTRAGLLGKAKQEGRKISSDWQENARQQKIKEGQREVYKKARIGDKSKNLKNEIADHAAKDVEYKDQSERSANLQTKRKDELSKEISTQKKRLENAKKNSGWILRKMAGY